MKINKNNTNKISKIMIIMNNKKINQEKKPQLI